MINNYTDFTNEKLNFRNLKNILPFIFFTYVTASSFIGDKPNIVNNSEYTIYLKDENSSKVIELPPGKAYHNRIDGIKHPKYGVYKVVDYVDKVFGIQIYNDDIKLGNLPLKVNKQLGGGLMETPPDDNWKEIFDK